MSRLLTLLPLLLLLELSCTQGPVEYLDIPTTYCNPVNLDYAYVPSTHKYYAQDQSHRSTANPVIVKLRDTLYLFSTNQNGYWWSADMRQWNFIKQDFQSSVKYFACMEAIAETGVSKLSQTINF